jgi:hypothetical protein
MQDGKRKIQWALSAPRAGWQKIYQDVAEAGTGSRRGINATIEENTDV